MGAEDEPTLTTTTPDTSDSFGPYIVKRREDGSPHELGRGAMGVTLLAEDVSLQRLVALKVIKTDIAQPGGEARERFMREARAAAALRHPNVATVYQFGIHEESGQCYYAMELVEGETLEDRVRRSGPLDTRSVVEIARQITAALEEAEKRRLVHRDLKPSNIMILAPDDDERKSGRIVVKIIDFGVAKVLAEMPDPRTLTHQGFIGTPAFASPEQLTNGPVNVRSDIYSLGATLWYLITGRLPFGGRGSDPFGKGPGSVTALPIEQLKASRVPSSLISLLSAMLAFEPGARPGVQDLASQLQRIHDRFSDPGKVRRGLALAAAGIALILCAGLAVFYLFDGRAHRHIGPITEKSVAVLPLENLSAEKENTFFADGLQDEILTNLAKAADLKVISRSSVMQYKASAPRDLRQIAQDLGVAHLMQGSVQRTGERIRVNVQLSSPQTNTVWAQTYDRNITDLFLLQSEIAQTIAGQLQATLSPQEKIAMDRPPTADLAAYTLYLRAKEALIFPGFDQAPHLKEAEGFLHEAIKRDPNFVLAYCELAGIYDARYWDEIDQTPECRAQGDAAVESATRLAPEMGEVHLARGRHFYHGYRQYDWARAEFALAQKALPNEPRVYAFLGYLDRRVGHWEAATKSLRRVCALDPANLDARYQLADTYLGQRRYAEVREVSRTVPAQGDWGKMFREMLLLADYWETADLKALSAVTPEKDEDGNVPLDRVKLGVFYRDPDRAEKALAGVGEDAFPATQPRPYWKGLIARLRGDRPTTLRFYSDARIEVAKALQSKEDNPELLVGLGVIDAILGNKDEALREGRRALELLPLEVDSIRGMANALRLVSIYAWVGDKDRALAELQRLVDFPNGPPYAELRVGPIWDPLRDDPRFQKILASLAPKPRAGASP